MGTDIDTEAIESSVQSGVENLTKNGWEGALKIILVALAIFVACMVVRAVVLRILDRGLDRSNIEKSFHTFIRSLVNIIIWMITIMLVAESFGFNANSLLALVGILGLAISLSVQGALSNLAGGISILGSKPFRVGDYVEIGDVAGTVLEIGMVHTKLTTLDHRRVLLPNSTVVGSQVTNYSTEPRRRVDLSVGASYDAPVELVKEALLAAATAHEKVLSDPAPFARLVGYGDSAMEYSLRVWCNNADYWTVYHDVLEAIKTAFDARGISIPYNHMDVFLKQES